MFLETAASLLLQADSYQKFSNMPRETALKIKMVWEELLKKESKHPFLDK